MNMITCNRDQRGPARWSFCQSRSPNPSARVMPFDRLVARCTTYAKLDNRKDSLL